ncbi:MAG TPA: hypothetical protein VNS61_07260, partial [Caldimonas sp.]|nr:hypothetical protein [Caldimonas sp.]
SGTSPVWQDGCTIMTSTGFVFEGCPMFGSFGGGGGGGGGTPPPPAATHRLDVTIGTWGGSIVSSPAGIDYSADALSQNKSYAAAFSTGSGVELCASPPPETGQAYDISWTGTGGCGGAATCTFVTMSRDQACRLEWTPRSP